MDIPYTGVAGHLSDADLTMVKIESLNNKQSKTMPLNLYRNLSIEQIVEDVKIPELNI